MKRIYTSLFALGLGSVALAQANINLPFESLSRSNSVRFESTTGSQSNNIHAKSVMYSEDFEGVTAPALPAGVTVSTSATGFTSAAGGNTAGVANNYAGFYTGNAAAANVGGYWPVPAHTTFAMANDDIAGDFLCDERLILPTQSFVGQVGMTLSFSVFNDENYGGGPASVKVSTDGGSTYTDVYTIPVNTSSWQNLVVNLSAYDGMGSVTIAFAWSDGGDCTASGDQWATGIAIDDIFIENAAADEIAANWLIPADISADYEYTKIPLGQARPLGASMSIANQGSNDQTDVAFDYDITLGGNSQATGTSGMIAINSFLHDTIMTTSSFTPSALGIYTITGTATMGATDANAANNNASATVEVTSDVWARDYTTFDGGFYNVSSQTNGEGVKLGHLLLATADQDFKSIHIGILNTAAHDGQVMFGELWYYDNNNQMWTLLEKTDDHTIVNSSEGGTILELPLENTVSVTAGMELLVVAGHYGGATDASNHVRFATAGQAREGTVIGFTADGNSFQLLSPPAPVVRLSTTSSASVNENSSNISVGQNYPNPFNGNTTVTYSLTSNDNVMVEITDVTGKVIAVMNEGSKVAGTHTVEINSAKLAAGTYYYSVVTSNGRITKAMTVAK